MAAEELAVDANVPIEFARAFIFAEGDLAPSDPEEIRVWRFLMIDLIKRFIREYFTAP